MSECFTGKTALITGASRGIGRAITTAFLEKGARVAGIYLSADDQANNLQARYPNFLPVKFDLTDVSKIGEMVKALPEPFAAVDILINNAGIKHRETFADTTPQIWEQTMAVNVGAPFFLTQAVAQGMAERRYGRIVNISSQAAPNLSTDTLEYGLSKNTLDHLTKLSAKLLARDGITVNGVSPGRTYTDLAAYDQNPGKQQRHLQQIPLGHINAPQEVADVVLFLAGEQGKNITGQIVAIDGGEVIR